MQAMLTALQKAACEATYRALIERNEDKTGLGLNQTLPPTRLRRDILGFVRAVPMAHLAALMVPELEQHGPLPPGYSQRWGAFADVQFLGNDGKPL